MSRLREINERLAQSREQLENSGSNPSETLRKLRIELLQRKIISLEDQRAKLLKDTPITIVNFGSSVITGIWKTHHVMVIPTHEDDEIQFCIDRELPDWAFEIKISKVLSSHLITGF